MKAKAQLMSEFAPYGKQKLERIGARWALTGE